MTMLIWTVGTVYVLGFVFVFAMEVTAGPVTLGLALLRATVWPLYLVTGIPTGNRLPMD